MLVMAADHFDDPILEPHRRDERVADVRVGEDQDPFGEGDLALEPDGNHVRQTDYDFWTSPQAGALIEQEGILLIDYRALQAAWQG